MIKNPGGPIETNYESTVCGTGYSSTTLAILQEVPQRPPTPIVLEHSDTESSDEQYVESTVVALTVIEAFTRLTT